MIMHTETGHANRAFQVYMKTPGSKKIPGKDDVVISPGYYATAEQVPLRRVA